MLKNVKTSFITFQSIEITSGITVTETNDKSKKRHRKTKHHANVMTLSQKKKRSLIAAQTKEKNKIFSIFFIASKCRKIFIVIMNTLFTCTDAKCRIPTVEYAGSLALCDSNHQMNLCGGKIYNNNNNMCKTHEWKNKRANNKAACWSNSECNHREIKSNINGWKIHSRSRASVVLQSTASAQIRIVLLHVARLMCVFALVFLIFSLSVVIVVGHLFLNRVSMLFVARNSFFTLHTSSTTTTHTHTHQKQWMEMKESLRYNNKANKHVALSRCSITKRTVLTRALRSYSSIYSTSSTSSNGFQFLLTNDLK